MSRSSTARLKEEIQIELETAPSPLTTQSRTAWIAVLVAALGYFVDVFDIWLFSNFRVTSLKDLGLTTDEITTVGARLLNFQQAGLLLGGILWGIMGDKKGRTQVMFGSILIYSLATILNAFVTNVQQYEILRFISGVGLAGEIGAGITLTCELLPKERRGWGTMLVTSLGVAGAIGAAYIAMICNWKTAYIVGGVMGLSLLILRLAVHESGMFAKLRKETNVRRGSLLLFVKKPQRMLRYLACIAVGAPVYGIFSLFAVFAPEIALALGISEPITVPSVFLRASIAMTLGDVVAGCLSQLIKSRKRPIMLYLACGFMAISYLWLYPPTTADGYMLLISIAAFFCGYWACCITVAAEQFGTNIRATATTTVPNFVRGSGILFVIGFTTLKSAGYSAAAAALISGTVGYGLAFLGLLFLKETYGEDLDYIER